MIMTHQPNNKECELYLDHDIQWAGDGYFCSKCRLRFEPCHQQETKTYSYNLFPTVQFMPKKDKPSQETRTCVNGHTGTGIGFDDACPECEGAWKPSEEWERQKIKSEFAIFFSEIQENLPKTQEMAAVGHERIYRAVYPAYIEIRKVILSQARTAVLEEVREMVEWMKESGEENDKSRYNEPHPKAYNKALDDLLAKLK